MKRHDLRSIPKRGFSWALSSSLQKSRKFERDSHKSKSSPSSPSREKRVIKSMKPCNKPSCETCPYVQKCSDFKGPFNDSKVKLNSPMDCNTKNVVYCIQCRKCDQIYIGQTSRSIKDRFSEHKTSVRTNQKNSIGDHFNGPGHNLGCMKIFGLEKIWQPSQQNLEKRESMWISKFQAEHRGLNRRKWNY